MSLVFYALNALRILVLVDAVCTWVQSDSEFPRSVTGPLLQPIYTPLRAILSPFTGRFDASPLVVLVLISIVTGLLRRRKARPGT